MFAMRTITVSLFGILLLVTSLQAGSNPNDPNNSCPNDANCPYGLDAQEPFPQQICHYILVTLGAAGSACQQFFGDSLDFTDVGDLYFGLGTTSSNVCDYFTSDTVVDDCLYTNGTIEINFCSPLFVLAYRLRNNCSALYTIDTCNISELGRLALNGFTAGDCLPGPYIDDCQKTANPQPPETCPNCIVASCPSS